MDCILAVQNTPVPKHILAVQQYTPPVHRIPVA